MLRDVSRVDTGTEILGQKISFPVCVGVTALHKLAHSDGELATARGDSVTCKKNVFKNGGHAVDIYKCTSNDYKWQTICMCTMLLAFTS